MYNSLIPTTKGHDMPTTWNFDLPYEARDEHEDDDWREDDDEE